jgi:phosphoesterase RecJ-like protein
LIEAFKALLNQYERVTVLVHRRPDGDTIGTALGVYTLLKNVGKQVEVCCVDELLPKSLDFLPHFARIKRQLDFDDSLIITCDGSTLDLFGFDIGSREIINIDHHESNTNFGTLNIVDNSTASTSQVAYMLLKDTFEINKTVATCFYVALLTDTQGFKTLNVTQEVFSVAAELLSYKVDLAEINQKLYHRKSLSSFRVLSATLDTLTLHHEAQVASLQVSQKLFEASGAKTTDLAGIVDYGIHLVTVQVAIILIEYKDKIKVSLRSKEVDVAALARVFGGGGHRLAAGFTSEKIEIEKLLNKILDEIKRKELVNA